MRTGDLRHRVILQRPKVQQDASGGVPPAWEDVAMVYAAIEPFVRKRGGELYKSDKYSNEVSSMIRIRHFAGLDESWRIVKKDQSHIWGITDVILPYGIKREMQLICIELPMGEPIS